MDQIEDEIKNALERVGYTYEVLLARGVFAQVFQVRQSTDGCKYAVKIIQIEHGNTAKYNKRELELIAEEKLSQPNIVKYYRVWPMTIHKNVFLCIQMELCSATLEGFVYNNKMGGVEIIKTLGPPRFYQQVFRQILNGLDAIHSIGWVHRDIHVSNILVANPKPRKISEIIVKIADFGLARKIKPEFDTFTSLSAFPLGTGLFTAPEVSSENYDSKVDIYSAGIVLYFLSCYLEDKTRWRAEIVELRKGNRGVEHLYYQDDIKLSNLFLRLLKDDPKERPTAREALEFLLSQGVPKADFLVQKFGGRFWKRCSLENRTLATLKTAIERCTEINAETQVIWKKKIIGDAEQLIRIESDQDVHDMFQEAEPEKARSLIVVSETENIDIMDVYTIDNL